MPARASRWCSGRGSWACSKPSPEASAFCAGPPPRWGDIPRVSSITLSSCKAAMARFQHGDKPMTTLTAAAPGIVRAGSLSDSIHVEPLTNAIGAELSNVDLGAASRDPALVAEIPTLLLRHRVLFFRDPDMT